MKSITCSNRREQKGRWLSGGELEIVGVHSALLNTGKVLAFGYLDEDNERFDGRHYDKKGLWQLWDPATRSVEGPSRQINGYNPFCAGHCFLADGRLLIAGGAADANPLHASSAEFVFMAATSGNSVAFPHISRVGEMNDRRWYPSLLTTAGGDCYIMGGSSPIWESNWGGLNDDVEYYSRLNGLRNRDITRRDYPEDGRFRPHDDRAIHYDGKRLAGLYPLTHLLPSAIGDGVFFVLNEMHARLYEPKTNRLLNNVKLDVGGYRTWWTQGSSVLLPIDIDADGNGPNTVQIMIVGGGKTGQDNFLEDAVGTASILDYDVARKTLSKNTDVQLTFNRLMGDSILLPDGNLAIVGGSGRGYANESRSPVLDAELLVRDGTGLWTSHGMADALDPRKYHATALLLPDATIFVSGGNDRWVAGIDSHPEGEFKSVEVFEPPYKFLNVTAPTIFSAPDVLNAGQQTSIDVSTNVEQYVVLIRHGSRTHSLDTDQRMLRLQAHRTVVNSGRVRLTFTMPKNPTYAPPGPYMMYVLAKDHQSDGPQSLAPSSAHLVTVTDRVRCEDDSAIALRVRIATGGDNLNSSSRGEAIFTGVGTASQRVQFDLNRGREWRNGSTHSVTQALPAPIKVRDLRRLEVSHDSGRDNWDINSIHVDYQQPSGIWKQLWFNYGPPLTRITGSKKTWTEELTCRYQTTISTPTEPPPSLCPNGQTCCEQVGDECLVCISEHESCP